MKFVKKIKTLLYTAYMLKEFEKYLEQKGYSRITPSGNPSTTADYPKRIEMVARLEQITIDEVVSRLETLIKEYDAGGIKEE